MRTRKYAGKLYTVCIILLSSMLACRPVIAIGWGEFFILVLVITLLIGPPIYRLMRRMNYGRGVERKDKTGK